MRVGIIGTGAISHKHAQAYKNIGFRITACTDINEKYGQAFAAQHGGVFETYDDHRMATAAAVIGLVVPGVSVVDVATTGKTLPGFVAMWTSMLGSRAA